MKDFVIYHPDAIYFTLKNKRKALIISVSDYQDTNLENLEFCKNDGEELFNILNKIGFDVSLERKIVGNGSGNNIRDAIIDFFTDQSVQPNDILFFYYSGHGVPDGYGGHYLASSDIDTEIPSKRGISFDLVTEHMKKCVASKLITVLDCCFSGAAKIGSMSNEEALARKGRDAMEEKFEESEGRCILASSLPYQLSFNLKDKPYSAFTYYLLEGLKGANGESIDNDGCVTVETLSRYIYDHLMGTPELRKQKPIKKIAMSGDIILAQYKSKDDLLNQVVQDDEEFKRLKSDLQSNKISLDYLVKKAETYYAAKKYRIALMLYDLILETDPENIWKGTILLHKGVGKFSEGNIEEAMKNFDETIELCPTMAEPLFYKGQAYHRLGKYDDALLYYEKALKVDPKHIDSLYSKAQILTGDKKRLSEAIQYYKQVLEINSEHADAYVGLAMVALQFGEIERAIEGLDLALQIKPTHLEALTNKGLLLEQHGMYEEALSYFNVALRIEPENDHIMCNKCITLHKSKKFEEAKSCFDKVLQINPNNKIAHEWRSKILKSM